jgi:hypothetical protein
MWKARVKVTSTRKQLTATDFATFRLRHHNSRRQNPTDNTSPSPPHPRPRLPRPPTRTEDQRLTSGRRLPGHLASSSGSRTNPLAKHQQHTFPKLQIKRSTAMVEFKNFDFNAKRGEHFVKTHSPYWKLGFDKDTAAPRAIAYLNANGYTCRQNATKRFALDAVGRYQRGLISYERFSMAELKVFCKARGLPSKATTVSRLARALERADDAATFRRFFKLPPELRVMIYELHFQSFDDIDARHSQPPLTLASRQLRTEALPLFYKCATFTMLAHSFREHLSLRPHLRSLGSMDSLAYMPAANFVRIKKFNLDWYTDFEHNGRHYDRIKVEITACFTMHDTMNDVPGATSGHSKATAKRLPDMVLASLKQNFGILGDDWGLQDEDRGRPLQRQRQGGRAGFMGHESWCSEGPY